MQWKHVVGMMVITVATLILIQFTFPAQLKAYTGTN